MATASDAAVGGNSVERKLHGQREPMPELVPFDERPTRGEPLPRHLHRHVEMASRLAILSGFTPPEPSAYSNPGGHTLFDLVFRTSVKRFVQEPPFVLPMQDMPGIIAGLPPLRLDDFNRDFAGTDHAAPRENLALAIELQTDSFSVFVPIAPGIDPDTADNIVERLAGREADFIDLDELENTLRQDGDASRSIQMRWVIATPVDIGDWIAEQGIAPAGLMLLRKPGTWDRLRAEMANIEPHWMPPFSEEAFERAVEDGLMTDPARLSTLYDLVLVEVTKMPALTDPRWEVSVDLICQMLQPLGRPRPERMAVVANIVRFEMGDEGSVEVGREVVCVGVSLDLHQARALHAALSEDPAPFVHMAQGEDWGEMINEPQITPTALLSKLGAKIDRRNSDGYTAFAARINATATAEAAERRHAA